MKIFGAPSDINGRLSNFNPALAIKGILPDAGTLRGFTVASNFRDSVPDGVMQTRYSGYYRTPYGDVSPRLGFAWSVPHTTGTVLRGGFGIYFDRHSGNLPEAMLDKRHLRSRNLMPGRPMKMASLESPFVPVIPPFCCLFFHPPEFRLSIYRSGINRQNIKM